MASSVASPLERQFTTIAGLDSMTSSSGAGSTNITLQFDLDRDIDSATVDVQTAIAAVMPLLPAGMPSPPSFRKNNPDDQPILMLNLTSNTLPLSALDDYAETMIAPRISMVSGVSQVQVQGASKYAVRVQLDPDKLHAQQIGLNEVDQALQNWNVNLPTGQLFGPNVDLQHQGGRPADERRRVPADHRHLPPRRAGAPRAGRERHRQRRERDERLVVLHEAERPDGTPLKQTRDHAAGDAAAGQQHHRGDRRGSRAAAGVRSRSCRRRCT